MRLEILGCSGGIGTCSYTTAMLLDEDILIDAGTGVGTLALDDLLKIDHIFVTHAHLDHIAYMRYEPITIGETMVLGSRRITPLPAFHIVPAVGFQLDSGQSSLVFTGDTTADDALWQVINRIANLRYLIIESAFSNTGQDIAIRSGHFHPAMLINELNKLQHDAEIYITHLRQGEAEVTMREILGGSTRFNPRRLMRYQVFEF